MIKNVGRKVAFIHNDVANSGRIIGLCRNRYPIYIIELDEGKSWVLSEEDFDKESRNVFFPEIVKPKLGSNCIYKMYEEVKFV